MYKRLIDPVAVRLLLRTEGTPEAKQDGCSGTTNRRFFGSCVVCFLMGYCYYPANFLDWQADLTLAASKRSLWHSIIEEYFVLHICS